MNILLLLCTAWLLLGGCADIKLLIPQSDKQVEETHLSRGLEYYRVKDLDNALQEFSQVLKLNPDNPRAHFQLAVIYQKRGQLDLAILSYERTLALNPQYSKAYFNLALLYSEEQPDPEKAVTNFNKFLELNPKYEQAAQIRTRIKHLAEQLPAQKEPQSEEQSALRQLTQKLSGAKPTSGESSQTRALPAALAVDPSLLPPLVVCISAYAQESKINCSGVVISSQGHILTASGKSLAESQIITVTRTNGDVVSAKLLHFDQATDVALLKMDSEALNLPAFLDAESPKPGDKITLIECFFGIESKIVKGTIIAVNNGQSSLLQTDIEPEENITGSPLFDNKGKLIGMVIANGQNGKIKGLAITEIKKTLANVISF
ncbi:MAG: tetratricopeptide repeat protein [Candidatus Schekmanbacteria bacterium]|nr:tetratricopeptide repeat protein [Candidatus Schekmanbacteria bacterium]